MGLPRIYWVGLLVVIRNACRYIDAYEGELPSDLPAPVTTAFPYIRAACAALKAYDKAKGRGKGV